MTERTSQTTLGTLWVQLCAADGAAASIMYAAEPRSLTEDNKLKLLTSFYRLRCKGYHPAALAKLCPKALLMRDTQEAITELPEVTEPSPEDIHEWGQVAARTRLGLL